VKQTVTELFVDAFTETVKANPPYTFNPEVAGYVSCKSSIPAI